MKETETHRNLKFLRLDISRSWKHDLLFVCTLKYEVQANVLGEGNNTMNFKHQYFNNRLHALHWLTYPSLQEQLQVNVLHNIKNKNSI